MPKIFVGTMYCQEGDFNRCVEMINTQEGVEVIHEIIADLPEKEAHNRLWQAWRDVKDTCDVFVKVDADTVLRSTSTLKQIAQLFLLDERVTGFQAPLHDYMTDGNINGLNAFSPRVTFNNTKDELYCDRAVDTGHDIILRQGLLPLELIPAGYHCHHSSEVQGFHYGLHRMLKGQTVTLDNVFNAWIKHRDRVRQFALVGAHMAPSFSKNRKFNYSDEEFQKAFASATARFDELQNIMKLS